MVKAGIREVDGCCSKFTLPAILSTSLLPTWTLIIFGRLLTAIISSTRSKMKISILDFQKHSQYRKFQDTESSFHMDLVTLTLNMHSPHFGIFTQSRDSTTLVTQLLEDRVIIIFATFALSHWPISTNSVLRFAIAPCIQCARSSPTIFTTDPLTTTPTFNIDAARPYVLLGGRDSHLEGPSLVHIFLPSLAHTLP
ncbi:hypothetical protein DL96DRAFT_1721419 [Flagelloscypha sp. PMI_526]|nr:hypothetical protein DL96DRAFT_1721419 [Flagelloscypha sp. PMI_526]